MSDRGCCVCVGGDKEGSGALVSLGDAHLNSWALLAAPREPVTPSWPSGLGGSPSDDEKQCGASRPGVRTGGSQPQPGDPRWSGYRVRGRWEGNAPRQPALPLNSPKLRMQAFTKPPRRMGAAGVTRPAGEKAESPVSDGTSPPPTPVPYSSWRPLGPAVPGLLVAAGHEAAGGLSGARLNGPGSSAAGKGPLQPPGTPAPSARVLLQRPLPIGLEEKVPLPAPEAGESEQRRRRGRAQTAGTWGCAGAERGAAGGAGPRSRSRAEGRPAAAVQPLTVRTDVLEAPSMGRKRNGAVMEAPISLFGAGPGPQIWGSLALGMLWARASNYGGGAFSVLWGAAHLFDIGGCDMRPAGQTAGICGGEGGPGSTPGFALPSAPENLEQMSLPVLDARTSGVLEQNLRPP